MSEARQCWQILVTRPEPAASTWAAALSACSYRVSIASVMKLVPVTELGAQQAIKNVVLDFDHFQKAMFVSANAVSEAMRWLEDYWPQLPLGVDYFAVGLKTAQALEACGLTVTALGDEQGSMNSEALLEAPALQSVADEKIVIFRGVGGRDLLRDRLSERGAGVTYCELYRRELPAAAAEYVQQVLTDAQTAGRKLLLTVHSGESLDNLVTCAGLQGVSLTEYPLLVPGERVAAMAQRLGFGRVITAKNASDAAMLQALTDYTDAEFH